MLAAPAAVLAARGQAGAVLEAFPFWVLGPGRMRRLGHLAGSALVPACSALTVLKFQRQDPSMNSPWQKTRAGGSSSPAAAFCLQVLQSTIQKLSVLPSCYAL